MENYLISQNPATEEVIQKYEQLSKHQIEDKILKAHNQWLSWRNIPLNERNQYMLNLAKIMQAQVADLSKLITLEMGKPIAEAKQEILKCASACEYFAQNSNSFLAKKI